MQFCGIEVSCGPSVQLPLESAGVMTAYLEIGKWRGDLGRYISGVHFSKVLKFYHNFSALNISIFFHPQMGPSPLTKYAPNDPRNIFMDRKQRFCRRRHRPPPKSLCTNGCVLKLDDVRNWPKKLPSLKQL